jgi:hypothetical protein
MKFEKVLKEKRIPITGSTTTGKKYNMYRGLTYLILDEAEPPDVHGIPPKLEAYGRGWMDKNTNSIQVDGGATGSAQGHPSSAVNGFYWGADYEAQWKGQDGKTRTGIMYVRGRAGTDTAWLEKNIVSILELIFKRLPRR